VAFFSKDLWINFKSSYSNPVVLKKSLWYIMGMAAYILVNGAIKCIVFIYNVDEIDYNVDKICTELASLLRIISLYGNKRDNIEDQHVQI